MKKKLTVVLLAVIMIFSIFPTFVFAENETLETSSPEKSEDLKFFKLDKSAAVEGKDFEYGENGKEVRILSDDISVSGKSGKNIVLTGSVNDFYFIPSENGDGTKSDSSVGEIIYDGSSKRELRIHIEAEYCFDFEKITAENVTLLVLETNKTASVYRGIYCENGSIEFKSGEYIFETFEQSYIYAGRDIIFDDGVKFFAGISVKFANTDGNVFPIVAASGEISYKNDFFGTTNASLPYGKYNFSEKARTDAANLSINGETKKVTTFFVGDSMARSLSFGYTRPSDFALSLKILKNDGSSAEENKDYRLLFNSSITGNFCAVVLLSPDLTVTGEASEKEIILLLSDGVTELTLKDAKIKNIMNYFGDITITPPEKTKINIHGNVEITDGGLYFDNTDLEISSDGVFVARELINYSGSILLSGGEYRFETDTNYAVYAKKDLTLTSGSKFFALTDYSYYYDDLLGKNAVFPYMCIGAGGKLSGFDFSAASSEAVYFENKGQLIQKSEIKNSRIVISEMNADFTVNTVFYGNSPAKTVSVGFDAKKDKTVFYIIIGGGVLLLILIIIFIIFLIRRRRRMFEEFIDDMYGPMPMDPDYQP